MKLTAKVKEIGTRGYYRTSERQRQVLYLTNIQPDTELLQFLGDAYKDKPLVGEITYLIKGCFFTGDLVIKVESREIEEEEIDRRDYLIEAAIYSGKRMNLNFIGQRSEIGDIIAKHQARITRISRPESQGSLTLELQLQNQR